MKGDKWNSHEQQWRQLWNECTSPQSLQEWHAVKIYVLVVNYFRCGFPKNVYWLLSYIELGQVGRLRLSLGLISCTLPIYLPIKYNLHNW